MTELHRTSKDFTREERARLIERIRRIKPHRWQVGLRVRVRLASAEALHGLAEDELNSSARDRREERLHVEPHDPFTKDAFQLAGQDIRVRAASMVETDGRLTVLQVNFGRSVLGCAVQQNVLTCTYL